MKKATTIKVDQDLHRRFKAACALLGIKMQDATVEAIETLLKAWNSNTLQDQGNEENNR